MVFSGVVNTRYPSHYCLLYYQQTFSSIVAIYHENDGEISGVVTKCCLFSYLSFFFLVYRVLEFKPIFRRSPYSTWLIWHSESRLLVKRGVGAGVYIFLKKNAVLGLGLEFGVGVKVGLTVRDMRVGIRQARPQGFSHKKWVEKPWGRGWRIGPGKGWGHPAKTQRQSVGSGGTCMTKVFQRGVFLFLRALIEP